MSSYRLRRGSPDDTTLKKRVTGPVPCTGQLPALPKAPKNPTTLNLEAWTHELDNDIDKQFILDGISDGFYLIDKNIQLEPAEMENYKSSTSQHALVEAQIRREISEGRYVVTPSKPTIVSAIGAIPKGPNAVRLIHDGSKAIGRGLNDYVSTTRGLSA